MFLANSFHVNYLYLIGVVDDRNIITEEDESEEDEEMMLKLYRLLSPDLKKMVRLTVNSAYLVERDRKDRQEG